MVGRYSTKSPLYDQEDTSPSEASFCLQMQIESMQAEKQCYIPQHLVTNLEYVLAPNKKRTKFLRARTDTCANVDILLISVYKVIYKDPDSVMLAPSNKTGITTYTIKEINVSRSCYLFVVHPDAESLKEINSKWSTMKEV